MCVCQIEASPTMPCSWEQTSYFTVWRDFTLNYENTNWRACFVRWLVQRCSIWLVVQFVWLVRCFHMDWKYSLQNSSFWKSRLQNAILIAALSESRSCPWLPAAYGSLWCALPVAITAHFPRGHIPFGRSFICQCSRPYWTIKILAVLWAVFRISKR